MQNTRVDAMVEPLRATPSRRTILTALLGGLPGQFLMARPDEAAAKQRKKPRHKRRRRKDRRPDCDVCSSGCEFTSVQAAIDAAASGNTIQLCAGSFDGPLLIRQKNLTLIGMGDDAKGTTLDGRGADHVVTVSEATVALKDVRLTGTNGSSGVFNNFGTLALSACTVSGNKAILHGGGIFNEGGELILNNCTVRDNAADDEGGGISVFNGALTLNASRVEGNTAGIAGGGLFFLGNTIHGLTLNESTVRGNTPDNFDER